jgi:hypothetical protein
MNNLMITVNLQMSRATKQSQQHGAEAARGAHNPEVTGSRPVAAITFTCRRSDFFPSTAHNELCGLNTLNGKSIGSPSPILFYQLYFCEVDTEERYAYLRRILNRPMGDDIG